MPQPTITQRTSDAASERFSATGASFSVYEWRGSGPAIMHVHHADDEAWHVLAGTLRFQFIDHTVEVAAGGTMFVPSGVVHTYEAIDARYLIILTPRLDALIKALQSEKDRGQDAAIYRAHQSEIVPVER